MLFRSIELSKHNPNDKFDYCKFTISSGIDIGVQTDEATITEEMNCKIFYLTQRIQMLEYELRLRDSTILYLSNGNAFLQQSVTQLNAINKLNQHQNVNVKKTCNCDLLTKELESARNEIKTKENLIKKLMEIKQLNNNGISRSEKSKTSSYNKRYQESTLGELLRWGDPNNDYENKNHRYSNITPLKESRINTDRRIKRNLNSIDYSESIKEKKLIFGIKKKLDNKTMGKSNK